MTIGNSALRLIAVALVALAVLKLTKTLTAPVLLAVVVAVILSPIVTAATRRGLPNAAATALVTVATIGAIVGGMALLAPALENAITQIPRAIAAMRDSLEALWAIGRDIDQVSDEVGAALGNGAALGEADRAAPLPGTADALLYAPQIAAQALIFLGTLFFFLLTREEIQLWVARTLSSPGHDGEVLVRLEAADMAVSRYFATITGINVLLGLAVTLGLALIGMPGPASWGLAAFLLNYLLYLGPGVFAVALLVAGHLQFPGLMSFAPMLMFLMLNFLEGYLITPSLVGQRLAINPLVVFLSLALGLWLWGVVGGIVALPVLVWVLAVSGLVSWSPERPGKIAVTDGD